MKGKICSLSAASFLLLAAVGSAHAQATISDCPPFSLNRRGAPTTPFRYTVNYAVSNSDPSGIAPGTETAVHIINRHPRTSCVYILFKDKNGVTQGIAQGSIPRDNSKVFATSANANNGTPPPFVVDYPASAVDTSSTTQVVPSTEPLKVPFEGRAEIYSRTPQLQVAPYVIGNGAMAIIPVQRAGLSSGND